MPAPTTGPTPPPAPTRFVALPVGRRCSRGAGLGLALALIALAGACVAPPAEAPLATTATAGSGPPEPTAPPPRPAPPSPGPAGGAPLTPEVAAWTARATATLADFEATIGAINQVWGTDAPGDAERRQRLFARLRDLVSALRAESPPAETPPERAARWTQTVDALDDGVTSYERWRERIRRTNGNADALLTRAITRLRDGLALANAWRRANPTP